jgi:sugar phosphate isomerase/epimerase
MVAASVREGAGGQLVFNTSSMFLRLIGATGGDIVGANLDPYNLMWMGADIPAVIRALAMRSSTSAAKDIHINDGFRGATGHWIRCSSPNYVRALRITDARTWPSWRATLWADFAYNLRPLAMTTR